MQISNYFVSILVLSVSFIAVLEASPKSGTKLCSKKAKSSYDNTSSSSPSDYLTSASHDTYNPDSSSSSNSSSSDSSSSSSSTSTSSTSPTTSPSSNHSTGTGGKVLLSSPGPVRGTYYYANGGKSPCGQDLSSVATQATYCEPHAGAKPLNAYGNNIVAMASHIISKDPAKYCGKEVQIFKDGTQIYPSDGGQFVIWDGCDACNEDQHLDFSVISLYDVFKKDVCSSGHATITWSIVDNKVMNYQG